MKKKFIILLLLIGAISATQTYSQDETIKQLKETAQQQKSAESYMAVCEYIIKNTIKDQSLYQYLDSAHDAAIKEKSDKMLAYYYYQRGKLYDSYNPDSATIYRNYLNKSIKTFEKVGITSNHAYYFLSLGINTLMTNQLDSCIYYCKKSLKKYQKSTVLPDDKIHKLDYLFIMHSYKALGQHDSAIFYGHKLISQTEIVKDTIEIPGYYNTIASIYRDLEKHNESILYYKKAAERALMQNNFKDASESYTSAALGYMTLKKYKEAIKYAELSLKYSLETKSKNTEGQSLYTFGAIYNEQKKYNEAISYYKKALDCYSEAKNETFYKLTQIAITAAYEEINKKDSTKLSSTSNPKINLAELEEELGLETALDTMAIPNSYQDLKLKMLISNANAEDKKVKFDILKQEYLEQEAASLKQRIWFIAALSGLIIILLLLLYNRQRQKAKAEKIARYAEQKENEYLTLQTETEKRLIRKYIDGLETERERISKELHDGVCNDLLALEMELKALVGQEQKLNSTMHFLSQTRENIRNVSHELMPPAFQYATIDEMIKDYISHIDKPKNISIKYKHSENTDWNKIPKEIAFEVYRIAQEVINNSIKHSSASIIDIHLNKNDNKLNVEINDNGTGFEVNRKNKGIGLQTINERAKSIGADLQIESNEKGTNIQFGIKL